MELNILTACACISNLSYVFNLKHIIELEDYNLIMNSHVLSYLT